ncbi:hypothetical protein LEMLEM_LOCUS2058, partial [Lemmus lemmus]
IWHPPWGWSGQADDDIRQQCFLMKTAERLPGTDMDLTKSCYDAGQ